MKHFPDEMWLGFLKGQLSPDQVSRMRAHLDSGCKKCSEVHRVWTTVIEVARRETDYNPPEAVVNAAKDAYKRRLLRPELPGEGRFFVLTFDSFTTAGAVAGIRSVAPAARHLLYQAGTLAIDVHVDAQGGPTVVIAGQILEAGAEPASDRHWSVTLMRGDRTVAQTSTNTFGEFLFECDAGPDLRIRLQTEGEQPFMLTLPD
jgi:hypothetical protein